MDLYCTLPESRSLSLAFMINLLIKALQRGITRFGGSSSHTVKLMFELSSSYSFYYLYRVSIYTLKTGTSCYNLQQTFTMLIISTNCNMICSYCCSYQRIVNLGDFYACTQKRENFNRTFL